MILRRRYVLLFLVYSILFGCTTVTPVHRPVFTPFSDFQNFVILEPLEFKIAKSKCSITVPAGFVTDLASIPQSLWSLLPSLGNYSRAAIVHDYLYWTQKCTRQQADNILLIAMKESKVDPIKFNIIYNAVKMFGYSSWQANGREKQMGYIKIIPKERMNFSEEITWEKYREVLRKDRVKEVVTDEDISYCECGNSADL